MLISIICGVYHAEKTIERLIRSILEQTYENFEVIFCLNASNDETKKMIDRYSSKDDRIKKIVVDKKLGAGGAREMAFSRAEGRYIAVVDHDDHLRRDYLRTLVEAAEKNDLPDIVFSGFMRVRSDGELEYIRRFRSPYEALYQSVSPWAKIYKRSFLADNTIRFVNIPFGEDILFTMDVILSRPQIVMIDATDYVWVDNPDSASHSELRAFPEHTLRDADIFFEGMIAKHAGKGLDMQILYLIYKYLIWYLLHSGRNVGAKRMCLEYRRAIGSIEKRYDKWERRCLKAVNRCKQDRLLVKQVLALMLYLRFLHLDEALLGLYSVLPSKLTETLWPSL